MQEDICWGKLGSFKPKQSHQRALEGNSEYLHVISSVRGLWTGSTFGKVRVNESEAWVEEERQERQRRKSDEELKMVQTSVQTYG